MRSDDEEGVVASSAVVVASSVQVGGTSGGSEAVVEAKNVFEGRRGVITNKGRCPDGRRSVVGALTDHDVDVDVEVGADVPFIEVSVISPLSLPVAPIVVPLRRFEESSATKWFEIFVDVLLLDPIEDFRSSNKLRHLLTSRTVDFLFPGFGDFPDGLPVEFNSFFCLCAPAQKESLVTLSAFLTAPQSRIGVSERLV